MTLVLRKFQHAAVDQLRNAAIEWRDAVAVYGPPKASRTQAIPLLAQLQAITGSGKTPILASVLNGLGPAIVFWTTKSTVVVDQTIHKLQADYRPLLPESAKVIGQIPTPSEWRDLLDDAVGTTIWVRTVGSWNNPADAKQNTDDARLNMHRPAPDWAGDRSPWDQLGDREVRRRPLIVVYDEGHGQTGVQLDQLIDLDPDAIVAATATPVASRRLDALREALANDEDFAPIFNRAQVSIPTIEVARAGLLKTTIAVSDLDLDEPSRVPTVVNLLTSLDTLAADEEAGIVPRAIYIVEQSDLRKGESGDAPPIAIWKALRTHGVPATEIAIATDTKDLPTDAEKVESFSALQTRHRHIIFNKKLQEGWDDPEAYVAYFDGETKSALRIKQLIGRVIRQPRGRQFGRAELNTAHLIIAAPNDRFDGIVAALQDSLRDRFGTDEQGVPTVVTVKVAKVGRPPIMLRAGIPAFELPRWTLGGSDALDELFVRLRDEGDRRFSDKALESVGRITSKAFALTDADRRIQTSAIEVGRNLSTSNRAFLLDRIASMSRQARLALNASVYLTGEMYDQSAAAMSPAQVRLTSLAREYVEEFETRVRYEEKPDPEVEPWRAAPFDNRGGNLMAFDRSLHTAYPDTAATFNNDEREFARALDGVGDAWWCRNFASPGANGYGVPLPSQIGGSATFYPDFLWWADDRCWAIDTTGRHILETKVHGKLLGLTNPRIALVARGSISRDWLRTEDSQGWTLVRPSNAGRALPARFDTLPRLLAELRAAP